MKTLHKIVDENLCKFLLFALPEDQTQTAESTEILANLDSQELDNLDTEMTKTSDEELVKMDSKIAKKELFDEPTVADLEKAEKVKQVQEIAETYPDVVKVHDLNNETKAIVLEGQPSSQEAVENVNSSEIPNNTVNISPVVFYLENGNVVMANEPENSDVTMEDILEMAKKLQEEKDLNNIAQKQETIKKEVIGENTETLEPPVFTNEIADRFNEQVEVPDLEMLPIDRLEEEIFGAEEASISGDILVSVRLKKYMTTKLDKLKKERNTISKQLEGESREKFFNRMTIKIEELEEKIAVVDEKLEAMMDEYTESLDASLNEVEDNLDARKDELEVARGDLNRVSEEYLQKEKELESFRKIKDFKLEETQVEYDKLLEDLSEAFITVELQRENLANKEQEVSELVSRYEKLEDTIDWIADFDLNDKDFELNVKLFKEKEFEFKVRRTTAPLVAAIKPYKDNWDEMGREVDREYIKIFNLTSMRDEFLKDDSWADKYIEMKRVKIEKMREKRREAFRRMQAAAQELFTEQVKLQMNADTVKENSKSVLDEYKLDRKIAKVEGRVKKDTMAQFYEDLIDALTKEKHIGGERVVDSYKPDIDKFKKELRKEKFESTYLVGEISDAEKFYNEKLNDYNYKKTVVDVLWNDFYNQKEIPINKELVREEVKVS